MTGAEALTLVQATTAHENDTQVTTAQIYLVLGAEWLRLRRWLMGKFPMLCRQQSSQTIADGGTGILKSAITNFDRIDLIERAEAGSSLYRTLRARPPGVSDARLDDIYFDETATSISIYPSSVAPGTYRVGYLARNSGIVAAGTDLNDLSAGGIPLGLEWAMIHDVCAWVRQKLEEDPSYHEAKSRAILTEWIAANRNRNGQMPTPGMAFVMR